MADKPVQFVGGDDFVEPFLLQESDGSISDLTGATVTGAVLWPGGQIDLAVDSGIDLVSLMPASKTDFHGYVRLSEAQTASIPYGRASGIRLIRRSAGDVKTSTYLVPLERVK